MATGCSCLVWGPTRPHPFPLYFFLEFSYPLATVFHFDIFLQTKYKRHTDSDLSYKTLCWSARVNKRNKTVPWKAASNKIKFPTFTRSAWTNHGKLKEKVGKVTRAEVGARLSKGVFPCRNNVVSTMIWWKWKTCSSSFSRLSLTCLPFTSVRG